MTKESENMQRPDPSKAIAGWLPVVILFSFWLAAEWKAATWERVARENARYLDTVVGYHNGFATGQGCEGYWYDPAEQAEEEQ